MNFSHAQTISVAIAITGLVLGDIVINLQPAEARRGFRAAFSGGRAAAGSAGRSASRSAAELSRIREAESRIDWGAAAAKGLEVVKTAIDVGQHASGLGGSSSGGSGAQAFSTASLGPVELEACVRESRWLDDRYESLASRQRDIDIERIGIETSAIQIDADRNSVDLTDEDEVDEFNERITAHGQQVDYFNSVTLESMRAEQGDFNTRVDQFNRYCDGKSYYASDLDEVERKVGFKLAN